MTVIVNGYPKSGTHALLKTCELLGVPTSEVNHIPFGEPLPEGTHLFIKRDPRNILISWLRSNNKPVTQGMFISAFQSIYGKLFPNSLAEYAGWLTDTNTYVIKFEDLISSDIVMRNLASYLNISYLEDAWPNLPGFTVTWTGEYSDWTKLWTPELDTFWNANGGQEILTIWNY